MSEYSVYLRWYCQTFWCTLQLVYLSLLTLNELHSSLFLKVSCIIPQMLLTTCYICHFSFDDQFENCFAAVWLGAVSTLHGVPPSFAFLANLFHILQSWCFPRAFSIHISLYTCFHWSFMLYWTLSKLQSSVYNRFLRTSFFTYSFKDLFMWYYNKFNSYHTQIIIIVD